MVVFNYSGAEINAKVVYYGPALSGKTTNLEHIYQQMPNNVKGRMVSMKTRTDRTLFFDFLPLELGEINGYQTRILLYTVPGQVYYNATRKLVLKGADAVVFVADSSPAKLQENIESLRNLEENLNEHGLTLDTIPWVIQYNKRDLPDALPIEMLQQKLNLLNVPMYEAVATGGQGLYETFQGIAGILYNQLAERLAHAQPAPTSARQKTRATLPAAKAPTSDPADSVSDVVDAVFREAPEKTASIPAPAAPATQTMTPVAAPAQVAPQSASPAPQQAPLAQDNSEPDFQFAPLEEEKIDETVGRVIDFEETQIIENVPSPPTGEFVLGTFTAEKGNKIKTAPQPAVVESKTIEVPPEVPVAPVPPPHAPDVAPQGVGGSERATADEVAIMVPVVITSGQMRKNIPIRLTLEIQVLDKTEI